MSDQPLAPSQLPEKIIMGDGQDYIVTKIRRGVWKNPQNAENIPQETVLMHLGYNEMHFWRKGGFTKKQRRHYGRLRAGFELAFKRRERITFLTLSTQYDLQCDKHGFPITKNGRHVAKYPREMQEKRKGINRAFIKLKQQIEYMIQKVMYERYCKRHKIEPYTKVGKRKSKKIKFRRIWDKFRYRLRYFKLKTSEGGGVLHIVFRKGYNIPMIPFDWLKKAWFKLWGAKNGVNIKAIDITDVQNLSFYMVGQYFAKQPVLRMSYSYFWIGQKVKQRIQKLIDDYGYNKAISRWKLMYQSDLLPTGTLGYQKRLRWRILPSTYFRLYLRSELIEKQKIKKMFTAQMHFWVGYSGLLNCGLGTRVK